MKDGTASTLFVAGLRVEREGDSRICEDLPAQAKFLLLPHRWTFVVIVYTLDGNPKYSNPCRHISQTWFPSA